MNMINIEDRPHDNFMEEKPLDNQFSSFIYDDELPPGIGNIDRSLSKYNAFYSNYNSCRPDKQHDANDTRLRYLAQLICCNQKW